MELALRAEITQQSGEDWKDVKLAVSTAQPGRGLYVPKLESHWLTGAPPPAPVYRKSARAYGAPAPSMAKAEAMPRAMMEAPSEEESYDLEAPTATAEQGLLAATFTTPRRETVDGSGGLSSSPLTSRLSSASPTEISSPAFL